VKRILGTALALVLQASSSGADEAFHCPEPGTVMTFSEGSSLTFTGQEGLMCRARTNKGGLVSQFLGLTAPASDLEKNHGERLFPWRVGNQVDFMTSGITENVTSDTANVAKDVYYDNSVKVVGQEKLVTPAGAFDTVVIEWHRQVRGKWLGAWATTVWFAPELGYWIKFKFETRQGSGPETSFEVASIARAQGKRLALRSGDPSTGAARCASDFGCQSCCRRYDKARAGKRLSPGACSSQRQNDVQFRSR
jgi:hypothetical protein